MAGHNWSPFLRGSGGRGVAPALGVLGVIEPSAAIVLVSGPVAGLVTRRPVEGIHVSTLSTAPALIAAGRHRAARTAVIVLLPIFVKSLLRRWVGETDASADVAPALHARLTDYRRSGTTKTSDRSIPS